MRVLVAGGAGFIGSHLCDILLQKSMEVVCVDNFYLGTRKNIEHNLNHANFTFYERDLCDLEAIKAVFEIEHIDYVFHLAANSDIQASAKNPDIELANTYMTTFNLLECMRLYNVERLFFASTSAIYGDKLGECVNESAGLNPISYYGAAKMGSEALISAFSHMNNFKTLVFRFPNVIGPRLTHGVIYDFIKKLRKDSKQLEILGDGKQTKPYMLVSDLVQAIVQFMYHKDTVSIFNIGVETQTSVTRIADIVCETMNLPDVNYRYTGGKEGWKGDVPVFAYDLTKIHSAGWKAKYTSDEAVAKTVESVVNDHES